jgi:DNA repair protein RadC
MIPELLELVLLRAIPRRDVEPLAKTLIAKFGTFAETLAAAPGLLAEVEGMSAGAIAEFKIVEAAAQRFAKGLVKKRLPMGSWSSVIDYCRTSVAFENREFFRILFLDEKNGLIHDEIEGAGTVDHTPVYPREVVRRALELSATGIILVHNHPSGDPTPSAQDIKMTLDIIAFAKGFGVTVRDHIIVGRHGHASLREMKFI